MTDDKDRRSPGTMRPAPGTARQHPPIVVGGDAQQVRLVADRLTVGTVGRVALDLRIEEVRRIQFDIERARPATLVIVPESPSHEPQVVSVPPEGYQAVGALMTVVGRRLDGVDVGVEDV